MIQCQAVLLEQDGIITKTSSSLNAATLLPITGDENLVHDCIQSLEQVYSHRPDLKDSPLENPDWILFVDGSSFVSKGEQKAGDAVVTLNEEIESRPLLIHISAQKAELIALTGALELSQGKRVNIFTSSKYTFGVVHAHGAVWKQRGLLSSQGTPVKHGAEILKLLTVVTMPKEVAVIRCKAHQFGYIDVIRDN